MLFIPETGLLGQEPIFLSDSLELPLKPDVIQRNNSKSRLNGKKILRDSIPSNYSLDLYDSSQNPSFLDTIKNRTSKKKWMKELANIIILSPDTSKEKEKVSTLRSEVYLSDYEGYTIREIHFIKLDVYGRGVYDSITSRSGWFTKTANNLHVSPSDKVLKRYLLFQPGDKINSRVL